MSSSFPTPRPRLPLIAVLACVALLPACSTVTGDVPLTLREACPRPTTPMQTQGDEDAYVVRLAQALVVCDGRRQALVDIFDKPKPWWRF